MREAFIETDKLTYKSVKEMYRLNTNIGILHGDDRYFMVAVHQLDHIAVRPGGWNELCKDDRYFIFNTRQELFDWMTGMSGKSAK